VNKTIVAVFMVALLIPIMSAGCEDVVKGSGDLETKQYDFGDFGY
jgi:hypothetical protein